MLSRKACGGLVQQLLRGRALPDFRVAGHPGRHLRANPGTKAFCRHAFGLSEGFGRQLDQSLELLPGLIFNGLFRVHAMHQIRSPSFLKRYESPHAEQIRRDEVSGDEAYEPVTELRIGHPRQDFGFPYQRATHGTVAVVAGQQQGHRTAHSMARRRADDGHRTFQQLQ